MSNKTEIYIQDVLERIVAEERLKERIAKDLRTHIGEACRDEDEDTVLARMGPPAAVAAEFMDSIYENKDEIIAQLVKERVKINALLKEYTEYKSKATFCGLPLVHIKFKRAYSMRVKPGVAKGIIAIGDVAKGVVAIGGIALGGICFGGVPIGFLAFGGLSLGLVALGGLAIGGLAMGGVAVGLGAIGGAAVGKIALGGLAKGTVAIGGRAFGEYVISGTGPNLYTLGHVTQEQAAALIRSAYPGLWDWVVNFFTFFLP